MSVPRFILWDQDGVLVDSERWYYEATRHELASLGVELTADEYQRHQVTGASTWDAARERGIDEASIAAARARRDLLYQESLRTRPIEVDGIGEVLATLGRTHRMAIVTTARREDFDLIHATRDLLRHMEFAVMLGDYERAKPHPDPYLAALARFGARPDEAVAVEDSRRGLLAARAAGIACFMVRNRLNAADPFPEAAGIVGSIRDLPAAMAGATGAS
jgi:HAD superfamily hydrolase (TIGR01509 family)